MILSVLRDLLVTRKLLGTLKWSSAFTQSQLLFPSSLQETTGCLQSFWPVLQTLWSFFRSVDKTGGGQLIKKAKADVRKCNLLRCSCAKSFWCFLYKSCYIRPFICGAQGSLAERFISSHMHVLYVRRKMIFASCCCLTLELQRDPCKGPR